MSAIGLFYRALLARIPELLLHVTPLAFLFPVRTPEGCSVNHDNIICCPINRTCPCRQFLLLTPAVECKSVGDSFWRFMLRFTQLLTNRILLPALLHARPRLPSSCL